MELIPTLKIGWFNGWILLVILYLIFGILLLAFPKDVRVRLYEYDRSSWSKTRRAFYIIGKLLNNSIDSGKTLSSHENRGAGLWSPR